MEEKEEDVVSEALKGPDSISAEKGEGLVSANDNVSSSSAAGSADAASGEHNQSIDGVRDDKSSNVSSSNPGSAKMKIGFKLPQLPLGKVSRPKLTTSNKSPSKLTILSSANSQSISRSSSRDSEKAMTQDQAITNEIESDVNQSQSEKIPQQMSSQKDTFAAPILPPKLSRKSHSATKAKPSKDTSTCFENVDEKNKLSTDLSNEKSGLKSLTEIVSSSTKNKAKSKSSSDLSPAEKLAQNTPIPYKEPSWSGVPRQPYHLEILKGGAIVSKLPLDEKPYIVFGRLESCDVMLEHPSISRYHMVLQYRLVGDSDNDPGFYVYDLDSTHGSFLNKEKLKPNTYYRMRVGHLFKIAGSTRLFILQGPAEDQEAESDLSVAELKQMRQKQLAELERRKMKEKEEEEEKQKQEEEERGISWGIGDDAEDEDPSEDNPFAVMTTEEREALYIKDPKKTLRGFFEREGYELEYDVEEKNTGHGRQYVCRVELPVDDAEGHPITAEAVVSGKKKEAVVACALEGCRILDAHGVLRQAKHESKKRKAKNWAEDDYYDSDDDTFLDRTGEIEKKRKARMKKAGVIKEEVETFASLTAKLAQVDAEIKQIDDDITVLTNAGDQTGTDDSLDAFMSSIKSGTLMDKTKRAKLKIRKIELRKDQARLMKLINIARPAALPEIKRKVDSSKEASGSSTSTSTKKLPMIGSLKGRLGAKKFKFIMPIAKPVVQPAVSSTTDDVEEEEEDEEEDKAVLPMETDNTVQEDTAKDVIGPSSDDATITSSADVKMKDQPREEKAASKQDRPVKGPTLPPSLTRQLGPVRGPQMGPGKADYEQYMGNVEEEEEEDDLLQTKKTSKPVVMETEEDVTDWQPPKGQTGDGRTSLNDKYGY